MNLKTINNKRAKLIQMSPFCTNEDLNIVHVDIKRGWIQARSKSDMHIEIYNVYTKQHEVLGDIFLNEVDEYIKQNYAATLI
jgi:hypothetical protein